RVDVGNLELDTNSREKRENGMAFTENSTTIDIVNYDKSDNGNENVDNENQMNYVENIIMIGTNEYLAANGIGNCADDDTENNVNVKKLKNVKRNRKTNSNTWCYRDGVTHTMETLMVNTNTLCKHKFKMK
ncbi:hypothetical protein HHI36_009236, partial [Cryptolaemus montrouzieri]